VPEEPGAVVAQQLEAAIERHAHARAVLGAALASDGRVSHAYLFHGPPGCGKRGAARAFAAALLAEGAPNPDSVLQRVLRGAHPDLTWVTPSGASEVLVGDVEQPVVAAATRTPFEAARRVFVVEAAGSMNEQAANRLLKTLEEPAPFVHLILLAEHTQDVLPTISSRCQPVRFDPLPSKELARLLLERHAQELAEEPLRAAACARLAGGDGALADMLAGAQGAELRAGAERFVRSALDGRFDGERPWMELLTAAKRAGEQRAQEEGERLRREGELLPRAERRRHEREGADAVRRGERRARSRALDQGLRLAELWLRDLWCVRVGAPELLLAVDRRARLEDDAASRAASALLRGVELIADVRLRLALNVSEELALEALAYRLAAL
jgi:DNA polymerase-3 subunit delta'